jgi:excisionase family DNA binding protein
VPKDPGQSWESRYAKLLSFVSRTGHARVPERHAEEGVRLGEWVRTQRRLHRRGRLPRERSRQLEALPGWRWLPAVSDTQWLDIEEAAALSGLSPQMVRRLVKDGCLPTTDSAGHQRIRRGDVESFIESNRISPGSSPQGLKRPRRT